MKTDIDFAALADALENSAPVGTMEEVVAAIRGSLVELAGLDTETAAGMVPVLELGLSPREQTKQGVAALTTEQKAEVVAVVRGLLPHVRIRGLKTMLLAALDGAK